MSSMSGSNEPTGEERGSSFLWNALKFCGLVLGGYWTIEWIISWF